MKIKIQKGRGKTSPQKGKNMELSELVIEMMERARRSNMTFEQWLEWMKQVDRDTNTPWEDEENENQ